MLSRFSIARDLRVISLSSFSSFAACSLSTMGWFHALAAEQSDGPKAVYHMCPKSDYDDKKSIYFPKAYDIDKFTRAQHEPSRLVETANCFYRDSKDKDWICLEIDTLGLACVGVEWMLVASDTDPEVS
jgi:hypothetical protein